MGPQTKTEAIHNITTAKQKIGGWIEANEPGHIGLISANHPRIKDG